MPSATEREFFGTAIAPKTFTQWCKFIHDSLKKGERGKLAASHNLHSVYLRQRDPKMNAFYARCDDCYIDGKPVRWLLRGFGRKTSRDCRFSLMDHFEHLLAWAQHNQLKLFYLGSAMDVVELSRSRIAQQYPQLDIHLQHGYFQDSKQMVRDINAQRPDLLLVGMGMPNQEQFLIAHLDQLDIGWATHCGATLDYYTGAQARPPAWISRAGLAWLYRLLYDPVRLWQRYLLEPWQLLTPTLRALRTHQRLHK